jgi:ATP-binding cassette subfamily B protein
VPLDLLLRKKSPKPHEIISSKKNQITVLIAHRLSTIIHADKIFVLEQGKNNRTRKAFGFIGEGIVLRNVEQQIGERNKFIL